VSGVLRSLGRGGLRVGPVGLGCAQLGNLYKALPSDVWPQIVPAAWDAGIRYFDVAPHYGLGLAETRLGEGLRGLPRDEVIVSTKVGRLLVDDPEGASRRDTEGFDVPADRRRVRDYTRDGILRSVEDSLTRTGLDRLDILFVHDPDGFEREALDFAFPTLDELRREGVIRSYGAGMNQPAMLTRFIEQTDLDIVMVAGRDTLLDRSAEDALLPAAARRQVSVVAAGVFNSGLLATDQPPADSTFDYGTPHPHTLARAREMAGVARDHGRSLPEAAAQFPLLNPSVSCVVLGSASPEQVRRNSALTSFPVSPSTWRALGVRA